MVNREGGARILIIGGSGFVSGTLARTAVSAGHRVWVLTRGRRPVPDGVIPLAADRDNDVSFARAITHADTSWDLVVDCIAYDSEHVRQDLRVLDGFMSHYVLISTDFVFDPRRRAFPQPEESDHYLQEGYGGKKRQAERALMKWAADGVPWTVVRPCHIYGPGSHLGCLPLAGRDPDLVAKLRRGETIPLVGGGYFLQQPIFVRDLAAIILGCLGNERTHGEIFCAAGPDIAESRRYYEIIADRLGVTLSTEEVPVDRYRTDNPDKVSFLCHRIYGHEKMRDCGLPLPATSLEQGLSEHVASIAG